MLPELPHAPPMVWLDDVTADVDGHTVTATRTIGYGHPFTRAGHLLPSALIELLAQTAAAGSALRAGASGRRVRRGLLVGISLLKIHREVTCGEAVRLAVTCEKSLAPLMLMSAQVHVGAHLVASASMTFHVEFE